MYATRKRNDDARRYEDYRDDRGGRRREERRPSRDENAPLDERTYGNVWTRVWENSDPRGRRYLTFSQHRIYERDGGTGITKSFRGPDAEDVIRGAQWAIGLLAEAGRETEPPTRGSGRRDDGPSGRRPAGPAGPASPQAVRHPGATMKRADSKPAARLPAGPAGFHPRRGGRDSAGGTVVPLSPARRRRLGRLRGRGRRGQRLGAGERRPVGVGLRNDRRQGLADYRGGPLRHHRAAAVGVLTAAA